MIERRDWLSQIRRALARSRVVALLGPRQCGKTTLAREIVGPNSPLYFDLEDPTGLARLSEPMTALAPLRGTVVIDEVQRRPELFPILRVLADRKPVRARFLVLGSSSPELLHQASESLAGRIETIALGGLSLDEVGSTSRDKHWRRGGFPRSFLARSEADSIAWRREMIQTFLERDVPQFGVSIPAITLRRFWTMVAHYHGGIWNNAEPARSLGVSEPTVRRYLDLLTGFYMLRQLQPWHENLGKRQVKSPKVYVRDSGLLHELLGIRSQAELLGHPKLGASFEGYAIEQTLHVVQPDEAYFWATHQGAELDLLLFKNGKRIGVEVKRQDAPTLSPSMRIALRDLKLDRMVVLYPGSTAYPLAKNVEAIPVSALCTKDSRVLLGKRRTA
jgi:predicted AAA+ superfamily ATPase